jgi:quercetin dioxygenase-like cupin family protein
MAGLAGAVLAQPAQPAPKQPAGRNLGELKFGPIPGLPTCTQGAVEDGDPATGPSILIAKGSAGCAIPWHFHTPNEHVMVVSGVARMEMRGVMKEPEGAKPGAAMTEEKMEGKMEGKAAKPLMLRAGGFALMPSRHVHQFRCMEACTIFLYSDTKFDIHYVDPQGKEISPEEALKPLKEQTAMR